MKKVYFIIGVCILVLIGVTMSVQDESYQEGVLNQYFQFLASRDGDIDPVWKGIEEIITLDDKSKFTRISNKGIKITKDNITFNISSDLVIYEVGDIKKTKEWEYKGSGWHYEIVKSNYPLMIHDNHVCVDNPLIKNEGSLSESKNYNNCIYYPPQLINNTVMVFIEGTKQKVNKTIKENVRRISLTNDYTARIDFLDDYDPTLSNLTVGLISCYSFDVNADDDYGTNDGVVSGATHITSGSKLGAGAYSFDGANDHIDITTTDFDISSKTVAFWFSDTTSSNNNYRRILASPSGYANDWVVGYRTAMIAKMFADGDNGLGSAIQLNNGQWHQIIIVTNGTTIHSFVEDGSNKTLNGIGTNWNTAAGQFRIGERQDGNGDWIGKLDEVMIWNVILNTSQIAEVWNNSAGLSCEDVNNTGKAAAPPADTCSPSSPLTGDHVFECADDCTQSTELDAGGNNIFVLGTGSFTMTADIINFGPNSMIEGTDTDNRCFVTCLGGCFRS